MSIEPSNSTHFWRFGWRVFDLDVLFLFHHSLSDFYYSLSDFYKLFRAGVQNCRNSLSRSAKINIAISSGRFVLFSTDDSYPFPLCIVVVLLLLLCLVICVINNRRARAASEQEYNVEANQVDGPPTIIATEYNPTSGPSGIYDGPKSGFSGGQSSAQMSGPTYPVAAQVTSQNRTAPVSQTTFAYPFPAYSSVSPSFSLFASRLF